MQLQNKVVVITGAASGIGRALAQRLAAEGCQLALADVQIQPLEALVASLEAQATAYALDVSQRAAVEAFAARVQADFGRVDVVINNAGVTVVDSVEQLSYADFEWLMNINFWGVVYGSKAFLPLLKQAPVGRLVNVSSVFGLIAFPGQAAYNASKFAVKGFTESLNQELRLEGSRLRAIAVHPGGIATNIARSARFGATVAWSGEAQEVIDTFQQKLARTRPEQAAETIVRGLRRDARRILIGPDAWLIDALQRTLPVRYQDLVCWGQRRLAAGRRPG